MKQSEIFKILEIAPTKDITMLENAYRSALIKHHPEDDPEGFKLVRQAYEEIISIINSGERVEGVDAEDINGEGGTQEASEAEKFAVRVIELYDDFDSRKDFHKWEELFSDPIVSDFEEFEDVRGYTLTVLISRFFLPNEVYKLIADKFNIVQDRDELLEYLPANFYNFLIYTIENDYSLQDFDLYSDRESVLTDFDFDDIDYQLPELETNSIHIEDDFENAEDNYISKLEDLVSAVSNIWDDYDHSAAKPDITEDQLHQIQALFHYFKENSLFHPDEYAALMMYYQITGDTDTAIKYAINILTKFTQNELLNGHYVIAKAVEVLFNNLDTYPKKDFLTVTREFADNYTKENSHAFYEMLSYSFYLTASGKYIEASDLLIECMNKDHESPYRIYLLNLINKKIISSLKRNVKKNPDDTTARLELLKYLSQVEKTKEVMKYAEYFTDDKVATLSLDKKINLEWYIGRTHISAGRIHDGYISLRHWFDMVRDAFPDLLTGTNNDAHEFSSDEMAGLEDTFTANNEVKADEHFILDFHSKQEMRMPYAISTISTCLLTEGKYDDSEEFLKDIIDGRPLGDRTLPHYIDLATTYKNAKKYDEAINLLTMLMRERDDLKIAYVARQMIAYDAENYQDVIDEVQALREYGVCNAHAFALAIRVFLKFDMYDSAREMIDSAMNECDKSDEIEYLDILENISRKEELTTDEVDNIVIRVNKILSNIIAKEKKEKGKSHADKLRDKVENLIDSDSHKPLHVADIHYLLTKIYIKCGSLSKALKHFRYTVDTAEYGFTIDELDIYKLFFDTDSFDNSQGDDVTPDFDEQADINNFIDSTKKVQLKNTSFMFTLSNLYLKLGDLEQGMSAVEESLRIDPNHPEAYNILMHCYMSMYNKIAHKATVQSALEAATNQLINKRNHYFLVEAGICFQWARQFNKAIEYYKEAISLNDGRDNYYAYNGIGRAYLSLGKYEDAYKYLMKAYEFQANYSTEIVYDNLVTDLKRMRRYPEALDILDDKRIQLSGLSDYDEILYAKLVNLNGDYDKCIKLLEDKAAKYKKNISDTNGYWYVFSELDCLILRAEYAIINNRDQFARYHNSVINLLNQYKLIPDKDTPIEELIYLDSSAFNYQMPEDVSEKVILAQLLTRVADYYMYSLDDYDTAAYYLYEAAEHLFTFAPEIVDDKLRFDKGATLSDLAECFAFIGDTENAMEYAKSALNYMLFDKTEEEFLHNPKNSAKRYCHLSMCYYILGDSHYKDLIAELESVELCENCGHSMCYERNLVMARIALLENDINKAITEFRICYKVNPQDCEIVEALRRLDETFDR